MVCKKLLILWGQAQIISIANLNLDTNRRIVSFQNVHKGVAWTPGHCYIARDSIQISKELVKNNYGNTHVTEFLRH